MRRIAGREHWIDSGIRLALGEALSPQALTDGLLERGYRRVSVVEEIGEFAVRPQGVIDAWPVGPDSPVRVRVSDGHVRAIDSLNIDTQRAAADDKGTLVFLPAREMPVTAAAIERFRNAWRRRFTRTMGDETYDAIAGGAIPSGIEYYLPFFTETATLLDFLPDDGQLFLAEGAISESHAHWRSVGERYIDLTSHGARQLLRPEELWVEPGEIIAAVRARESVIMTEAVAGPGAEGARVDVGSLPTEMTRQENLRAAIAALRPWFSMAERIFFVMRSEARRQQMDILCKMLRQKAEWVNGWDDFMDGSMRVGIGIGAMEAGFYLPRQGLLVMTEKEIFGQPIYQKDADRSEGQAAIGDDQLDMLSPGDPIVHVQNGVGRLDTIEPLTFGGVERDFLTIAYDAETRVFVKMEDLDLVMPYAGTNSEMAPFDAAKSKRWIKGLAEAQKHVREIARDLIRLDERRRATPGIAFDEPGGEYERFANEFPFQETRDQAQAISDIIDDMIAPTPMDRVVCGDVGFGKTEVAMRAAFVAAASGYQVAVMVPTTLLASQHFESFRRRFASFEYRIELLARSDERSADRHIVRAANAGEVDILIGTHRLLQGDISLPRLGLLVVDEEHRFGVQQKARLRELRGEVDALALTATPIPRTLSLAMHGIRDLSIIATPPAKRLSIRTTAQRWSATLVSEAVSRERQREGQVFYVHNRVESIDAVAEELTRLLPDADIRIAHGKMAEAELEAVMSAFYRHEFDVLLCTTIIETGIDIPNANTIIIDQAENFGLAQLHQLRGRVGRSHRQAYAYMLTRADALSETAERRLRALSEATKLGQGYMLAAHDLEIRGAGELLGEEQSGSIQAIGFQLYMRLLERAIEALKAGEEIDEGLSLTNAATIEIGLGGHIPPELIDEPGLRLGYYKRLVSVADRDEVDRLAEEIADRFGEPPKALQALLRISNLRAALRRAGVHKVIADDGAVTLDFRSFRSVRLATLFTMIERDETLAISDDGRQVILSAAEGPDLAEHIIDFCEAITAA
nr:transcription-repair coupling factor [Natronocella acetinitrilica]